jgi:hypothetical protein
MINYNARFAVQCIGAGASFISSEMPSHSTNLPDIMLSPPLPMRRHPDLPERNINY